MFHPANSITLRIPVLVFRQLAYASMDDMLVDAWISPETVKLRLSVALASVRDKTVAGFQVVTRERATGSKYVAEQHFPAMSAIMRVPMVPSPLLQDALKG